MVFSFWGDSSCFLFTDFVLNLPCFSFAFAAHMSVSFRQTFADAPFFSCHFLPRVTLPAVAYPGLFKYRPFRAITK